MKIIFPYGIFLETTVSKIVDEFKKSGFLVDYLNVKGNSLLEPIQKGDFDILFIPYQGVFPDPDGFLDLLDPGSLLAQAHIPSKNTLLKLDKIRFESNRSVRLEKYEKILKALEEKLYFIPFCQNAIPIIYSNKIRIPNFDYTFHLSLRDLSIN